jgi:hypothetical protein
LAEFYDTARGGLLDFISDIYNCTAEPSRWRAALESTSTGIILTDAGGKIVHTNSAADGMLDGRVLLCVEDQLSARDSRSAADLQAAIAETGRVLTASHPRKAISLIAKGPGSRSIAIWVIPLDNNIRRLLESALAARIAVFAQEVGDHPHFTTDTLVPAPRNPRRGKSHYGVAERFALSADPIPAAVKR